MRCSHRKVACLKKSNFNRENGYAFGVSYTSFDGYAVTFPSRGKLKSKLQRIKEYAT